MHFMKFSSLAFTASLALFALSCSGGSAGFELTDPIEDGWDCSQWISVADAPVVEERITDGHRAADGASWFVFGLESGKAVKSVRWMTAGLGVYQLYVNGNIVGDEVLKPGFTHPFKTKRSFT